MRGHLACEGERYGSQEETASDKHMATRIRADRSAFAARGREPRTFYEVD
jgi:hypothetical protein